MPKDPNSEAAASFLGLLEARFADASNIIQFPQMTCHLRDSRELFQAYVAAKRRADATGSMEDAMIARTAWWCFLNDLRFSMRGDA